MSRCARDWTALRCFSTVMTFAPKLLDSMLRYYPEALSSLAPMVINGTVSEFSWFHRILWQKKNKKNKKKTDDNLTINGLISLWKWLTAGRSCQVWCYLRSGGLMTGGWTFPDGTRCQMSRHFFQDSSISSTFCLSGRCQVIFFFFFRPSSSILKPGSEIRFTSDGINTGKWFS